MTDSEIEQIEKLLRKHRDEMDVAQFDHHLQRPEHYLAIPSESEMWRRIMSCRRSSWPADPALSIAFDRLTMHNPAYRLTREFVSAIIEESRCVTSDQIELYVAEIADDQWTYDSAYGPEEGESFESHLAKLRDSLSRPATGVDFVTPINMFRISGLPEVCFVEETTESTCHFHDQGDLLVPMLIPIRSSSHLDCYIL